MKKIKYLLMGLAGLLMCSCTSVKHTATVAPVEAKVVNFTVADMDVSSKKVSKTYSWNYNPFKKENISTIKTNTTAALLDENGADVLLEPQYIVEQRGFLRGGSVTVIGFPAKYKNFHKMTQEEAEVVKAAGCTNQKTTTKRWFLF